MMKTNRTIVVFVALLAMLSFVSAAGEIVTKGGKLGVGITNPTAKLDIYDPSNAFIRLSTTSPWASGIRSVHDVGIGQRMEIGYIGGDSQFYPVINVRGNGNVGIGTTTPLEKLEVRGAVIARNAAGGPGFVRLGAADPNYGDVGTIDWKDGAQLRLRYWVGSQAIDVMTLAGGNVGIGTTSPTAKLNIFENLGAKFGLIITNRNGDNNQYPRMIYSEAWTGSMGSDGVESTFEVFSIRDAGQTNVRAGATYGNERGNSLVFDTRQPGGGYNTNQLVLSKNGNVGIGTSTPSEKLQVAGNVKANSFIQSSDARLKNVLGEYNLGLNAVMQLNPKVFEFKNSDGKRQAGFVAQDVQKVLPEAVIPDTNGYLGLNNEAIISALVNGMQEQQKRIEALEKKCK